MEKIITFIIPAYNSEHCLGRCLDSFIVNGTAFPEEEILIINDGSTDGTAVVAEEYIKRFPEAYHLINKENGGHGSAINVGSMAAAGKYFKVIDADDWVLSENLRIFIEALKQCGSDVVLTPFHQVDCRTGKRSVWKMYCESYSRAVTMKDIVKDWKAYDCCLTLHGITYRTEFYRKHRYELPGKIFYEDQEYAAVPCCHASEICPLDIFLYQYSVGSSSQSMSEENRLARQSHVVQVTKDLLGYRGVNKDLSEEAGEYLYKKTEVLALSHYVVTCLLQKQKQLGRKNARNYHDMILKAVPEWGRRMEKKYRVYLFLNYIHMPYKIYQKLLNWRIYSILRGSHRIEKEPV